MGADPSTPCLRIAGTMLQVVWFKRDLRIVDHTPLAEAARRGPVLPLYVAEPDYWGLPDTSGGNGRSSGRALKICGRTSGGSASRWWCAAAMW